MAISKSSRLSFLKAVRNGELYESACRLARVDREEMQQLMLSEPALLRSYLLGRRMQVLSVLESALNRSLTGLEGEELKQIQLQLAACKALVERLDSELSSLRAVSGARVDVRRAEGLSDVEMESLVSLLGRVMS